MKINYKHLPLKAHYFFSWAIMGAIFPFLPVYGKQLGISPLIMGTITAILHILYMIAKPIFGFIVDYFHSQKKLIFMIIIIVSSSSYILLYSLPALPGPIVPDHFQNVSCASLPFCDIEFNSSIASSDGRNTVCYWICKDTNFLKRLSFHTVENEIIISPNTTCLLNITEVSLCQEGTTENYNCNITCNNFTSNHYLYTSVTFWGFVLLMSFGNIGISVVISINDGICFEILGKGEEMNYGWQRVWGGFGFGLAGFLSGYTVNVWSHGKIYKTLTPAFLFVLVFTCIDLIFCKKLKLSCISTSTNIFTDVWALLKSKFIIIFLSFAIIVGAFDGYILYFSLWYEEDLAMKTGYMAEIKLIEGLTVAAECFGSAVIFMPLSGKILKKLGYGYTFTLSLVFYALRLGLISVVPTPWWIVLTEFLMVGPTFCLSHATAVAFANAVSTSSISLSVQGITTGMKDGFGIAIGNVIGSILLKNFGGALTLQIFSIFATFSALVYLLLYITYLKYKIPGTRNNVEFKELDDARRHCVAAE